MAENNISVNLKEKVGRATKWSSITEIFAKIISPVVNMVLARLLTPEAFGAVATITMVITFAEIFTDAGFQKYLIQHEFKDEEELNKNTNVAFWTNLVLSLAICVGIYFFRHEIANLVGSPGLGNAISIATVLIIIVAFSSIQTARCKRDFDFKTLFYARMGSSFTPLIVTIPLAIVLKNFWALLIGNILSHFIYVVVLTTKSKWKIKFSYSFKQLKEMFSFSAFTLLETITIWISTNVGIFIVGRHLNEYYLGLYKTTISTVTSYMGLITAALLPVLFASLSRYQNDEENFKKTYYTFQRIATIFVFPMGIGMAIFNKLVTKILLGSQWMEISWFMGVYGLSLAITIAFSYFASEVYRSKGKPLISFCVQVVFLIVNIIVLSISVKKDFKVLCFTTALANMTLVVCSLVIMRFIFYFRVSKVVKNVTPMAISSLLMGVVGFFLEKVSQSILWQLSAVLICAVLYFAILILLFPKVKEEIFNLKAVKKIRKLFLRKKTDKTV